MGLAIEIASCFLEASSSPSVAIATYDIGTPPVPMNTAIEASQATPPYNRDYHLNLGLAIEITSCTPGALRWRWSVLCYIALPYGYAYAVSQVDEDVPMLGDNGALQIQPEAHEVLLITRYYDIVRVIELQ